MAPRYRVNQRTFIAPHTVETGSVIETNVEPSVTWTPVNDEAKQAMESVFNKKFVNIDEKGNRVETQPNLNKRPIEVQNPNADQPRVELISVPRVDDQPGLSLAESALTRAEPDLIPRGDGTSRLNLPTESVAPGPVPPSAGPPSTTVKSDTDPVQAGDTSVDGGTTIVAPAAPPQGGLFS